jgi:hypothetical protein
MPRIMVVTHTANGRDATVFLAERLRAVQLDDAHYAGQLVERLKWAVEDAEHAEREAAIHAPRLDEARAPGRRPDPRAAEPVDAHGGPSR